MKTTTQTQKLEQDLKTLVMLHPDRDHLIDHMFKHSTYGLYQSVTTWGLKEKLITRVEYLNLQSFINALRQKRFI